LFSNLSLYVFSQVKKLALTSPLPCPHVLEIVLLRIGGFVAFALSPFEQSRRPFVLVKGKIESGK
jgi:hypothetical protein